MLLKPMRLLPRRRGESPSSPRRGRGRDHDRVRVRDRAHNDQHSERRPRSSCRATRRGYRKRSIPARHNHNHRGSNNNHCVKEVKHTHHPYRARHRSRSPRPRDFLPFFPRSASPERHVERREKSPRSKALTRMADAWFLGVNFLTSLDNAKQYTDNEMADTLNAFLRDRKSGADTSHNTTPVTKDTFSMAEINLRSLVASLDTVDAHVRALAGRVEELKTYARSPLFLSILRVIGHACMFADLGCGALQVELNADGTDDSGGGRGHEQKERLVSGSEALVDKCNLAVKAEREWIVQACRRMCEAYMTQARTLSVKVLHLVEEKINERKKQHRCENSGVDTSPEGSLERSEQSQRDAELSGSEVVRE
eukprot:GEMP01016493.1.p1 GENE.GEMP01016493.1~~GEMP01016493.1.p1  ORF type:complete len:367 (+),score=80.21 GEMP01016493.1:164-1264(+)